MKILIVDDEEVIRDGMAHVLPWEEHQFQILKPAASGEEALKRIQVEKPEIIITDIMMQGISGLELVAALEQVAYPKEIIILSGYDEFNFVQEALRRNVSDYLLKTSTPSEILSSVKRARTRLLEMMTSNKTDNKQGQNRLIKKILLGNHHTNELKGFEESIKRQETEVYQLILIDKVLDEHLNTQAEQIGNTYVYGVYFIHHEQTLILVKRQANLSDEYSFQVALKKIFELYEVPMFVSDTFPLLEKLPGVFEIMKSNMNYQYLVHDEFIINPSLIYGREGISHHECFSDFEQSCLAILRVGTKVQLVEWVDKLVDWLFTHPQATPKSIESYIHHLYFSIVRYIEQLYELYTIDVKKVGLAKQLFQKPKSHLLTLFLDLQEIIQSQETGPQYVKEALLYIDKHLHESITLQDVANAVHIHPNYLSEMLRKESNNTFLEIVTEKRMGMAKELIQFSEKPIQEVAISVGYTDRKYFTQLFKRFVGCTPTQYRKRAIEKQR